MDNDKIIADYLRWTVSSPLIDGIIPQTDKEVIEIYGGEDSNEILCSFDNGSYLYKAVTSTPTGKITFYTVIDTLDYADSYSAEVHEPK